MGKVPASPKRETNPTPAGLAGSNLNLPLHLAMETLGMRSHFRDNGPLVFENLARPPARQLEGRRKKIAEEKAAMDKSIVEMITTGRWEPLEPNSSKSVAVGNHHVCVSYDEEMEVGYRTWEWHGHMLVLDEEEGNYRPEYVYGNFFEPLDGVAQFTSGLGLDRMMAMLGRHQRFF